MVMHNFYYITYMIAEKVMAISKSKDPKHLEKQQSRRERHTSIDVRLSLPYSSVFVFN